MSKQYYFWNGRFRGLPGAFFIFLGALYRKFCDKFNTILAKNNLGRAGNKSKINSGVIYRFPGNISLGNNVSIARGAELSSENPESKLIIGDNVVIAFDVRLDFSGGLIIGKNTLISKNTIIETHDHGMDPHALPDFKTLEIGENVWIGMNAVILPGVRKIGKNAVIAAGSVVTKEVSENILVGGVPAREIRKIT